VSGLQGLLGFQPAWSDPASGKDLMGARWYAPSAAHFTSADTVQDGLSGEAGDSCTLSESVAGEARPPPRKNAPPARRARDSFEVAVLGIRPKEAWLAAGLVI
jgi:hypothetical protein